MYDWEMIEVNRHKMKTQIVVVFLVLLEHSDSYLAEAQPLTELIYSIISLQSKKFVDIRHISKSVITASTLYT